MFCPHCGTETALELNYCKRCGGTLNPLAALPQQESRPAVATGTAWAVGTTTLFLVVVGLGIVFAAAGGLSRSGVNAVAIVWMTLFGALTIIGSVALLMSLWMRLLGATAQQAGKSLPSHRHANSDELGAAKVNALTDAPGYSVTEHTTRTLEHAKK